MESYNDRHWIKSKERCGVNLASREKLETHVEPYNNKFRFTLETGDSIEWISFRIKDSGVGWTSFLIES